jgi:GAF domain-containing protein
VNVTVTSDEHQTKVARYDELLVAARSLLAGEHDLVANMSNLSALIYETLPALNGVFFYRWVEGELLLGPFQGRVACVHIAPGQGVCGKVVQTREPEIVPDVHQFPGHIACDERSRSEAVIPLFTPEGEFFGVLDLDSPEYSTFDAIDAQRLPEIGALIFPRS